jgi:hypothetical protein
VRCGRSPALNFRITSVLPTQNPPLNSHDMIAGSSTNIRESQRMTEGFASIITQLERQRTAIERALTALREIDGIAAPATATEVEPPATPEAPIRKRKKFSAAARRKMGLAQKERWAKIKGESEPPSVATPEPPKPKRRISEEGMKRIIAATKKRWRLRRAAAA